jgi:hypothetical protein
MRISRFAATSLAAMAAVSSAFAVDFTPISSTSTRMSITGFIQAYGTEYFNASQGPTGAIGLDDRTAPDSQFVDTVRTSRITFTTVTPNPDLGDIGTTLEMDFAPSGGATSPHLRLAYGTWGNFTLGQNWSNWIDGDAAADEVDWDGPVGQACYDVPRVLQASYKFVLDKKNSIILALEHNSGAGDGANWNGAAAVTAPGTGLSSTVQSASADAKYPNLVAAYQYYDKWGHIALRGLAQDYGVYALPGATGSARRPNKWGTAIQLSGQVNCFGLDVERDSFIYNIYTGSGLGPYGVGVQAAQYDPNSNTIKLYKNTGWTAGYTHTWTTTVRSNLVLSAVNFSSGDATTQPGDIKSQQDVEVNTFVKMNKSAEFGIEYMYETVKTFNPNDVLKSDGSTGDRNTSGKLEVELKFNF